MDVYVIPVYYYRPILLDITFDNSDPDVLRVLTHFSFINYWFIIIALLLSSLIRRYNSCKSEQNALYSAMFHTVFVRYLYCNGSELF